MDQIERLYLGIWRIPIYEKKTKSWINKMQHELKKNTAAYRSNKLDVLSYFNISQTILNKINETMILEIKLAIHTFS